MSRNRQFNYQQNLSFETDESILPMINVAFLLLVFFMIAGLLTAPDFLELVPPESSAFQPEQRSESIILIDRHGAVAFDGRRWSIEELKLYFDSLPLHPSDELMQIKADGEAPSGVVVQIMEMLRESGAAETRLITLHKESL